MKLQSLFLSSQEENKIIKISKALGSKTRYNILKILIDEELDISGIAEILEQTEANVSAQVKYLQKLDLISCKYSPGIHGVRKLCRAKIKEINIELITKEKVKSIENGEKVRSIEGEEKRSQEF